MHTHADIYRGILFGDQLVLFFSKHMQLTLRNHICQTSGNICVHVQTTFSFHQLRKGTKKKNELREYNRMGKKAS